MKEIITAGDVGKLDAAALLAEPVKKKRGISNSLFKLFRRNAGEGDDAWVETGEVYRIGDDCGTQADQRLTLDDFLVLRTIEDGYEYKAEPA